MAGWKIETSEGRRKLPLKQIHIEEDAGKLVHDNRIRSSLVDFNRTSVPLIEIVSNPDFRSAEEVLAYLEKLRQLLSFAGVSDCKMQEGSMRCDVNISVREKGATKLGTRTEIKNLNSLKAIAQAMFGLSGTSTRWNRRRGTDSGNRRWMSAGETFQCVKRKPPKLPLFPNPELMTIEIGDEWIEKVLRPSRTGHMKIYSNEQSNWDCLRTTAGIITGSKNLADIFDSTMEYFNNPRECNWIIVEMLSIAKGK